MLPSLDNTEWMRNGDYPPSRLEAQNEAALLAFNAKRRGNAESQLAIMTMGSKGYGRSSSYL